MTNSSVSSFVPSVCPHDCPSVCALEVEKIDERTIGKVRGAKDQPYTAGVVCSKVSMYRERVHHPDRLTHPLRRTGPKGSGEFEQISWDEALDSIADEFRKAAEQYGPETVWPYFYAGTMGLVQRDGINRLRHVMGYSRMDKTFCTAISASGWKAGVGVLRGVNPLEIHQSDLIIVWGGNPVSTQVNLMTHISKARKGRGAKLVVIDPYRSPTAEIADLHIAPKPGTDGALATAMMHILFAEGFADREYMAKFTDVPEELEAHLADKTPAWAAEITGLSELEIYRLARLYGQNKRSFIRVGYGFSRSRNGASNMHAVSCLPAVTGAWQYPGGGALQSGGGLYDINSELIEGLDKLNSSVRMLDMSELGPVLLGEGTALRGGPPVTAMIIQNTNPALVAPELAKVHAGFAREDLFVCVHEQFMTETARFADIVLPATTFLEHDDLYTASGHTFLQIARQIIEPLAECRSNHYVMSELAKRLGATHRGFDMTELELIDETLKLSGRGTAAELEAAKWLDCAKDFDTSHFLNGFGHADGKFRFAPDWASIGADHAVMPRLPDHLDNIEKATEDHPFRLMTSPARRFLNSTFTETPTSRAKLGGAPVALVHPLALEKIGVGDGGKIRMGNARGSVVIKVKAFDGMQHTVVVVEGIWPGTDFEEQIGINVLIGSDRAPPNGGAVFHDIAVWMKAI